MPPHTDLLTVVLAALVMLAVVGLGAVYRHARRTARLAAWRAGALARASVDLARAVLAAAVLTGGEWAAAVFVGGWLLVAVLAVPALLAGWTLVRRDRGILVLARRGRAR